MAETVGFIGLGNMGLPMARNLLSAGFPVRVWNRTRDKARQLAGATVVDTPAQAAVAGGILVSMLADDASLAATVGEDVARALGRGGVHLSMSTVAPGTNQLLSEFAQKHGASLVSAPVFGRPEAAAGRKLWIVASGDPAAKARVRPLLDAVGQGVFDFGPNVGAANVVKLAGNFLLSSAIESMSEACAMAEKHGIPRADLLNMFTATLFGCPIYNNYAKRIIDADFDKVGFTAELALKDMRLAREASVQARAPMPVLDVVCGRYLRAIANGRGGLDASAIAGEVARDAGLKWER